MGRTDRLEEDHQYQAKNSAGEGPLQERSQGLTVSLLLNEAQSSVIGGTKVAAGATMCTT